MSGLSGKCVATAEFPPPHEIARLLDERLYATCLQVGGRCEVEGPLSVSEESVTYRATCPAPLRSVLLKHPRGQGMPAHLQYEGLLLAHRRLVGQSGLLVPRVYPYLLDDGFVIVEWIDAPTVGELLRDPRTSPTRAASVLEVAGKWLKAFHADRDTQHGRLNLQEMLDDIRTGVTHGAGWSGVPRWFHSHLALLEAFKPMLESVSLPFGPKHGDFKPDNVMVNRDGVIGIDISSVRNGPIVHDLAHFLLHLDLQLMEPRGWRLLPLRRRLRSAFLRGYGLDGQSARTSLLSWVVLQRTLSHFSERLPLSNGRAQMTLLRLGYSTCAHLNARDLRSTSSANETL